MQIKLKVLLVSAYDKSFTGNQGEQVTIKKVKIQEIETNRQDEFNLRSDNMLLKELGIPNNEDVLEITLDGVVKYRVVGIRYTGEKVKTTLK